MTQFDIFYMAKVELTVSFTKWQVFVNLRNFFPKAEEIFVRF